MQYALRMFLQTSFTNLLYRGWGRCDGGRHNLGHQMAFSQLMVPVRFSRKFRTPLLRRNHMLEYTLVSIVESETVLHRSISIQKWSEANSVCPLMQGAVTLYAQEGLKLWEDPTGIMSCEDIIWRPRWSRTPSNPPMENWPVHSSR